MLANVSAKLLVRCSLKCKVSALRAVAQRGSSRLLSSYVHDHYHQIQAANAGFEKDAVYNALEVRNWLQQFSGGQVLLEFDDSSGIAVVTLDNPDKRNALSGKMMVELADVVTQLEELAETGRGRGIILRGANRQLCSGGDLDFMEQIADPISGRKMSIWMQHICFRLIQMPLLSVALVEGHALGGGAELTMVCDWRLMDRKARLGFVHGSLGVSTGWSAGTLLTRRLGYKTALTVLTSANIYDAEQAKDSGLIDELLTADSKDAPSSAEATSASNLKQAKTFLHKFLDNISPQSGRVFKEIVITASDSTSWADSLRFERDQFAKLWGSGPHRDALKRISDKKP